MKLIKFRVVIRFAYSLLITPKVGGGVVAAEFQEGEGAESAARRQRGARRRGD